MSPRQVQALKIVREWGPLIALALGVKILWPADQVANLDARTGGVEVRVDAIEETLNGVSDRMDAYSLSQCLQESHPIVRRALQCGRLEQEAGVTRRP